MTTLCVSLNPEAESHLQTFRKSLFALLLAKTRCLIESTYAIPCISYQTIIVFKRRPNVILFGIFEKLFARSIHSQYQGSTSRVIATFKVCYTLTHACTQI